MFGVAYFLPYNAFNGCNYSYQQADMVKLDILLNGQPVDAMATIVHSAKAYRVGRELTEKLKGVLDRSFYLRNNCIFSCFFLSLNSSKKTLNYVQANVRGKHTSRHWVKNHSKRDVSFCLKYLLICLFGTVEYNL